MSVLLCDSNCELWHTRAKELGIDFIPMPYFDGEIRQPIGPVIGSHCGPGTIGVIFIADERPIALEK